MKNLLTGYDFSFNQFGIDQSVSAGFSHSCPIDTTFCKIQSAILRAKWCTIVQTTMPTDNILHAIILLNYPGALHLTTMEMVGGMKGFQF